MFEKKVAELIGIEVSTATTLTRGGVVKPGVGKSPKVLGLSHGTISGETRVSKISPSKTRPREEKLAEKISKFKFLET